MGVTGSCSAVRGTLTWTTHGTRIESNETDNNVATLMTCKQSTFYTATLELWIPYGTVTAIYFTTQPHGKTVTVVMCSVCAT